jgi:hypothetical protein
MTTFSMPSRRVPGLLLIAVLHLGLLYAFLQTRPHPEQDHAPRGPAIQWLRYVPPPAPTKPRAAPLATLPGKPVAVRQARPCGRAGATRPASRGGKPGAGGAQRGRHPRPGQARRGQDRQGVAQGIPPAR